MSGSLSALQMLPGHHPGGGDDDDHPRHQPLPNVHADDLVEERTQTGLLRAGGVGGWLGGETTGGLREGNLSTASRSMSFAQQKGKIPLSASKSTLGSLLFAVDEGLTVPTSPDAVGTLFPRKD